MERHEWKVLLAVMLLFSPTAFSQEERSGRGSNPYEGADKAAVNVLNQSLGSVGRRVVVKVSSSGEKKSTEYYAKIPGDKYSPEGDTIVPGCADVSKRIVAAVDKAKKGNGATTITILVEAKVPKK